MTGMAVRNRFTGGAGYASLTEQTIRAFLESNPEVSKALGGRSQGWSVREVGDGNLNLVFVVKGPVGGVCVKQALPYVRLVGESWPLPIDRAHFEHEALKAEAAVVSDLVPKIYVFDKVRAAIVMELLEPHIILRKGLIQGIRYPKLADDIARFAAQTLFSTSDLALPAGKKREQQSMFSLNTELCRITEDLVFTDPYRIAELNRWTSPQLDHIAAEFREDAPLKIAVQELKWMFLSRGEALLHGDLHTGSIMVTSEETRVIDPEFAFYGPMGFDLGAFMANLLLSYYSQDGHATAGDDRSDYQRWLLDTLEMFWGRFETRFLELWRQAGTGDAFVSGLFEDEAGRRALEAYRVRFMARLLQDSIGFTGAKMARRILGLAHVEDMESIKNTDVRARCERRALILARQLMVGRSSISSIAALRQFAETCRKDAL
ncbi:S-methyl-5-thioribose kinase [Bradyrhizobium sp.]|uniref:S-methyl-5-thioribose kinase n=1 Tax=Bradyrhizobium sp. TaxID=376 RepID=UPI002B491931|nr:S-methyl-5-thioribose kinase [Bradyrhizobium sp.]